jgi:hypothetical protein
MANVEKAFTREDTESTENTFVEMALRRSVFSDNKLARCGQFEGEFATMREELKIPSFKFFSVASVPSVVKMPCT